MITTVTIQIGLYCKMHVDKSVYNLLTSLPILISQSDNKMIKKWIQTLVSETKLYDKIAHTPILIVSLDCSIIIYRLER